MSWGQGTTDPQPYARLAEDGNNNLVLTFYYNLDKNDSDFGIGPFTSASDRGWHSSRANIKEVVFDESFASYDGLSSMNMWFYQMSGLTKVTGISNLNTANVTSLRSTFNGCSSLTSLDLSSLNTSEVKEMNFMFEGCSSLTDLKVGFSTENVTTMANMFLGCSSLTTLDLSTFNTANVKSNMDYMFSSCSALTTIYVSDLWTTENVTSGNEMFNACHSLVGGQGTTFSTSHRGLDYAHIDGGTANPGYFTDKNAAPYVNPEPYVVLSDNNTVLTFYYDDQKATLGGININNSNLEYAPSPYGTATSAVFDASFANYYPTSTAYWFQNCSALTSISGIDNLKTDNVTDMGSMFTGCSGLTSLNVSGFNTANVTNMSSMFEGCAGLSNLDVSGFNTANVTNMTHMFMECSGLEGLDLSNFDTSNVTEMYGMFLSNGSLKSLNVSSFNTSKVVGMNQMFCGLGNLTNLNVNNFDTSNVKWMYAMFAGCVNLTSLDLSSFNSGLVSNMGDLFSNCVKLKTIYVGDGWSTTGVGENGNGLFNNCTNLIGGAGTVYDPDHIDYTYAHIDEGTSNPGYFTLSGDGPYVPVDVTFDNHGVLTVGGTATMAEALETVGGVSVVAETITAVVWNSTATLTNSDLQDLDNPNMLVYVPSVSQAPVNRDNVIIGNDNTGYTAKNIVLTDVESGNQNFYCPKAFVAEMITYAHDYLQQTEIGVSRGWETIALPFTVQTIMHEKQGVIAPFGNDASNKHFWLRQLMMQGLTRATVIEANTPYLIAMPNSDAYAAEFNLNGRVTFSSQNVEVPQTQMNVMEAHDANDNMMMFVPCFQAQPQGQEIYALNVGEQRDNHPEGSVFEANYREVRPFEAFTVHNGNGPAPRFVLISEMMGGATEIEDVRSKMSDGRGDIWYDMNGRKLQKEPTRKGVYLNKGRKVVVQK
jgi:surface protein